MTVQATGPRSMRPASSRAPADFLRITSRSGTAKHVARWVGAAWSSLSIGLDDAVFALSVFDDGSGSDLFVGGGFLHADAIVVSHVARWDGASWSTGGAGLNASVRTFAVFDNGSGFGPAIVAGGSFTIASGTLANYASKWNGTWWEPLSFAAGAAPGPLLALASFDDGSGDGPVLYAGGDFAMAGTAPAHGIARWRGSSWSAVGTGLNDVVYATTTFDDGSGRGPALYAGGLFTSADGVALNHVAMWTGSSWSPLGTGTDSLVLTLTTFDDGSGHGPALYAGGSFTTAGGVPANHVAKWDGRSWSALGSGLNGVVRALTSFDDGPGDGPELYAGGYFGSASGTGAISVAKWNGSSWSAVGSGMGPEYAEVFALTSVPGGLAGAPSLVAGGSFTTTGGVPAKNIARWDGSAWSSFGSGMNARVNALEVFDDGAGPVIIAGGYFTTADGAPVNHIAKWDGASWSQLGGGVGSTTDGDAPVRALLVFDDWSGGGAALYAGGLFSIAGGLPAKKKCRKMERRRVVAAG